MHMIFTLLSEAPFYHSVLPASAQNPTARCSWIDSFVLHLRGRPFLNQSILHIRKSLVANELDLPVEHSFRVGHSALFTDPFKLEVFGDHLHATGDFRSDREYCNKRNAANNIEIEILGVDAAEWEGSIERR